MLQTVNYWGVTEPKYLCLSSGSIPQCRRNKPFSLLYNSVCVVSWPEDLVVPPVRSHIWTNIKKYTQKTQPRKRVLLTLMPSVAFSRRPPDKGLLRRLEEGAYLKQGCSFHLWSLVVNHFGKTVPFTAGEDERRRCGSSQNGLSSLRRDGKYRIQKHRPNRESYNFLKLAVEFVMTYLYTVCDVQKNQNMSKCVIFYKEMSKVSQAVFLKWTQV